jgi:hypothetical protein
MLTNVLEYSTAATSKVAAFSNILVTTFRITHYHIPEEHFTVAITRVGLGVTQVFLASW